MLMGAIHYDRLYRRSRKLNHFSHQRPMDSLCGELSHLCCFNRLAATIDAVTTGEYPGFAGFHIFVDDNATATVCFDIDYLFEKCLLLGLAHRLNDHIAGNLEHP